MRNKYLYITLLALLGYSPEILAQGSVKYPPRLVVNITIDQLRTDYMEAFAPLYGNDGFKALLQRGTVFSNASYPFSPIDRASAVTTLATGATPYYHSIIGEKWLDRETLCPVSCVGIDFSAKELSASTIGDELKVATEGNAKVFSISPFEDAAVLSAGHAANGAFWMDEKYGVWLTSTYYASTAPSWLNLFSGLHAPASDNSQLEWEPVMALSGTFNYFQHTTNNQKPFKHKFTGDSRYGTLMTSGLINAYVTDLALECLTQELIGVDLVTDYMTVNYYAGTFEHKAMSECQLELQDTYVRLDRELAKLIQRIQSKLGKDNVLFVITSTGYSDVESADYEKYKIPTGTFYMKRSANLLNMFLGAVWGQGRYVESCFRNQMFFNHKLLESKRISLNDACLRAQEFLAQLSGVRNVYSALQLMTNINEQTLKLRNGFNPARCGDIIIEVSPGWKIYNEDNQETQLSRASFIQFPVIFYGADMKAERIDDHVTVDRIAPTIAKTIRIRAPNACSAEPLF